MAVELRSNQVFLDAAPEARLRRLLAIADAAPSLNPDNFAVMDSPPTITTPNAAPWDLFTVVSAASSLSSLGGLGGSADVATSVAMGAVTVNTNARLATSARWEIRTDAPKICFAFATGAYTAMVQVGNRWASASPVDSDNVGTGTICYLVLDFGSRAVRDITVYCNSRLYRIYKDPDSTVAPIPQGGVIRAAFVGDSITQGTGCYRPWSGITLTARSYACEAARQLGWRDPWAIGLGGTGYVADGQQASATYWPLTSHLGDITNFDFDVISFFMGANDDAAYSAGTLQAAIDTSIGAAREAHPGVPILVHGPWPLNSGPSTTKIAIENLLSARVTARNDKLMRFVPVCTDTPPWIYGTGYTGSPHQGNITFTAPLSSATSATLTTPFPGTSGTKYLYVDTGNSASPKAATFTNGGTSVTWTGALTAGAAAYWRTTTTTAPGNADFYNGSYNGGDSQHPTPGGHVYLGRLAAQRDLAALKAMLAGLAA